VVSSARYGYPAKAIWASTSRATSVGYTLVVAGVAYVADTLARGLLSDYAAVQGLFLALVAVPSMIGEGGVGLWLLLTKRIRH
jgi:hypothetical protein